MAFSITPQIDAVAGAHLTDLRLHAIEVAGHQQIRLSIAVDIGGEHSVHGSNLRFER